MIRNNYTSIEYRERSYSSQQQQENTAQPFPRRCFAFLQSQIQSYFEYHDQICLRTQLNDRIVSTGIYKETLEQFAEGQLFDQEQKQRLFNFFQEATGFMVRDLTEKLLQAIGQLMLSAPDSLEFIKEILSLPKRDKLLFAFTRNPELLTGLETSILRTMVSLENAFTVIMMLGKYPLWQFNRNLLKEILKAKCSGKMLCSLMDFPCFFSKEPSVVMRKMINLSIPFSERELKVLWKYPKLLSDENLIKFLDKISTLSYEGDRKGILKLLVKYPELFSSKKLTSELWDKIFAAINPPGILYYLVENQWLSNEKLMTELLYKILIRKDPGSILSTLEKYPRLLSSEKITSKLWSKILAPGCPTVTVLELLGSYPQLLSSEMLTEKRLGKILNLRCPSIALKILGKDNLLFNEKFTEFFDKILALRNPYCNTYEVFEILTEYQLLSNEKFTPELFEKIADAPHLRKILMVLGQYPQLLSSGKITSKLWDKIFVLSASFMQPTDVLNVLAQHSQLLSSWQLTELLEKLFDSCCSFDGQVAILEVLGKYPQLLSTQQLTIERLGKFFNLPGCEEILETLGEYPQLCSKEQFTAELLDKIMTSDYRILKILAKHFELLSGIQKLWNPILDSKEPKSVLEFFIWNHKMLELTMNLKLWKIAISQPHPLYILESLVKYPELLKMKEFTPELLNVIVGSDFKQMLATFDKYPQLLTVLPINELETCFTVPEKALAELLMLGKKLVVDEWKKEFSQEIENNPEKNLIKLLTIFLDRDIDFKIVKAFFKLGDEGIEYAEMYLKADSQRTEFLDAIMVPYVLVRLEQLESKSPGPFLNLSTILKDPKASKWNILPTREGNIDDNAWQSLKNDLVKKIKELFPGNAVKKKNAKKWFKKIMKSRDALFAPQTIRKRVASIIDFCQANEAREIAEELIKILAEGGTACSDRAIEALEDAEIRAKAFNGEYIVHIAVNNFKRKLIVTQFIDRNQGENIETFLYHMILLNHILGLEYATEGMLHENCAVSEPLKETMQKVYQALTLENLIGHVQEDFLIEPKLKADSKAITEFEKLLNDPATGLNESGEINSQYPDDIPDEFIKRVEFLLSKAPSGAAVQILFDRYGAAWATADSRDFRENHPKEAEKLQSLFNQMPRIIDNFKAEKTKELLLETGFLSNIANYQDISSEYFLQEPVVLKNTIDLSQIVEMFSQLNLGF